MFDESNFLDDEQDADLVRIVMLHVTPCYMSPLNLIAVVVAVSCCRIKRLNLSASG